MHLIHKLFGKHKWLYFDWQVEGLHPGEDAYPTKKVCSICGVKKRVEFYDKYPLKPTLSFEERCVKEFNQLISNPTETTYLDLEGLRSKIKGHMNKETGNFFSGYKQLIDPIECARLSALCELVASASISESVRIKNLNKEKLDSNRRSKE